MTRADLVARLAALVASRRPVRIAVDGPDAAGKTMLADELAAVLPGRVVRLSVDSFHRPEAERRRRGDLSPEGYYLDAFDLEAVRLAVLAPREPGTVLVVDGTFLLREELRACWDLSVLLQVSPDESLRRALTRDVERFGSAAVVRERYLRRYLPGQELYRAVVRPAELADVVVDNEDPPAPVVQRWPPPPWPPTSSLRPWGPRGEGQGGA